MSLPTRPKNLEEYDVHSAYGRRDPTIVSHPSFRSKMDSWSRKSFWLGAASGLEPVTRALANKTLQKDFFSSISAPFPATLAGPDSFTNLKEQFFSKINDQKPIDFVLKPTMGKNSWGVLPVKILDNQAIDLFSSQGKSIENHINENYEKSFAYSLQDIWIVEELVSFNSNIVDIKLFCFNGDVRLILASSYTRAGRSFIWLDLNGNQVDTGRHNQQKISWVINIPKKVLRNAITTASAVSRRLPIPFARIDLLCTTNSVFCGEITPWPGHYYAFNDYYDRLLGSAFELAEIHARKYGSIGMGPIWGGKILGY